MDDHLWLHLRDLPAFRALLRAVEARFYDDLALPRPALDLGCGDGHFAATVFGEPLEAGLDPRWEPLTKGYVQETYCLPAQALGARIPCADGSFASVISNSALEHIPQVEPVLAEVARVLRPGGLFYFCVPGPNFHLFLSVGRGLDRIGLHAASKRYRRFFDRISRHYHCDPAEEWERRLKEAGLRLTRWRSYFSRRALAALEWGHYFGLPSLVCKKLTGRWLLSRSRANLWLTERILRPLYEEPLPQDGAYLFFEARRDGG